ncbi:MAG: DUF11 domain-containing protein [Verrucomicrobia bacterium]|nr:DUF11 domain-containing protein [Verrucomicrobiota bacterium]
MTTIACRQRGVLLSFALPALFALAAAAAQPVPPRALAPSAAPAAVSPSPSALSSAAGAPVPPPLVFGGNLWIPQGPGPTTNAQVSVPPDDRVSGCIQAIAAHPSNPDILYIGAVNGGIWRTFNATAANPSWTPLTDTLASLSIGALEFDPTDASRQTLVAGSARLSSLAASGGTRLGVLRTVNGGATWTALGSNLLANENITSVAARSNIIMAASDSAWGGGNGNGIFRSVDFGATFLRISGTGNLLAGPVSDLVGDPVLLNRFYAAARVSGVFRTDDAGATWTNITAGLFGIGLNTSKIEMAVHNSGAGNAVFAGIINNGFLSAMFRSTNAGATWARMDTPPTHNGGQGAVHFSIAADPTSPNIVYVGGDSIANSPFTGNLFRGDATRPAGSQFTSIVDAGANGTAPHADSREMLFDANGNILESDDGGIFRRSLPRSNLGVWSSVVGNLAVMEGHDVAYDSVAKVAMVGVQDNGTQIQSAAGGLSWQFIFSGDGGDVAIDSTSTPGFSHRYGSAQDLQGFFRFTFDASNNLVSQEFPPLNGFDTFRDPQFVTPIVLNKVDPTRLVIGGGAAAYESFDAGTNVTRLAPAAGVNSPFRGGCIAYGGRLNGVANPEVLYYGSGNTIRRRTTAGAVLTQTAALPVGAVLVADVVLDTNDWRRVYVIDSDQVFFSSNAGTNWSDITGNLTGVGSLRSLEFAPFGTTNAVIVGTDRGVYCSFVNAPGVWQQLGSGLPNAPVYDMVYDPTDDVLVVSTLGRGTFKLGTSSSSADVEVTLVDNPDPVVAGQNLTYTATVINHGPSTATGVALTNALSGTVLFISAAASQGSIAQAGGVVSANLGTLTSGASATVTIVVKPSATGPLNNTVSVAANELDSSPANNTATVTTTVTQPVNSSDLFVTITDAPDPINAGQPLTYTITVGNLGTNDATGVLLVDPVPAGAVFLSGGASQGIVSFGNGQVVASLGNLATGATATVNIVLQPIAQGQLTNTVTVFGNEFDPNIANNTASTETEIDQVLYLFGSAGATLVSESFAPPNGAVDIGETVSVQFGVQNLGAAATSNLVATLLPLNGVTFPSQSQTIGLLGSGAIARRTFSFTAASNSAGILVARVFLNDGTNALGTFDYPFPLNTVREATNSALIIINDNTTASPYPSVLTVTNVPGTITKVTVTLTKFTHAFPDDVDILLVGPTGQKMVLMSDAGGNGSVNNLVLTFDDDAPLPLPNGGTMVSGTFRPTDYEPGDVFAAPAPAGPYATNLATFKGRAANGDWSLYIVDDTGGDSGQIVGGWSLKFQTILAVNPPGDLALGVSASPASGNAGFPLIYTIAVTNSGTNTANGVILTDTLPPGMGVVTMSPSQGTASNNAGVITANLGSLPVGLPASVTVTVIPAAPGLFTNTVSVSASQTELNPGDNTATLVTTVNPPAPVLAAAGSTLVAEGFNPPNAGLDAGETVTLRLALKNIGTANATNLVATLLAAGGVLSPGGAQNYGVLPAGGLATDQPFSFTVGAPAGGVVTATLQLRDGPLNLGTVNFAFNIGDARSFTNSGGIVIPAVGPALPYPATINVSGLSGVVSKLTVTLNGFSHAFPADVDVLVVGPAGQPVVVMSDAGRSGSVSNLTLTFDDAAAAPLSDTGLLASGTFKPTDYEPGDVFEAPAPAGPHGSQLTDFVGTAPNGTWSLFVRDDTAGDAGQIANGWKLDITTVNPLSVVANLGLAGSVGPDPVVVGTNLNYFITVTNLGPSTATGVLLSNAMPAGAKLLSATSSQGAISQLGDTLFLDLGTLPAGGGAVLAFSVGPVHAGSATNVASVAGAQSDLVPGNNTLTLVSGVTAAPAPFFTQPKPLPDGTFQFDVNGQTALSYVVEATANLINWTPIATNIPFGGKITFTDPGAASNPVRFYRLRQLTN